MGPIPLNEPLGPCSGHTRNFVGNIFGAARSIVLCIEEEDHRRPTKKDLETNHLPRLRGQREVGRHRSYFDLAPCSLKAQISSPGCVTDGLLARLYEVSERRGM